MKILLVAVNARYIHSNLAVYSLRQYAVSKLQGRDVDIEIAEYTVNNRIEEIVPDIYGKKADVIAFSVYIWNVGHIVRIAESLGKVIKGVPIWAGGPEVSYRADRFLIEAPVFSLVMCGEGEKIFSECVNSYYDGGSLSGIVKCESLLSMDEIPYVYDNTDEFRNKIIYYETSRGCPFSCSYCLSSVEKTTRFRDIGLVRKELQHFLDNNVKLVKFVDRTFNANHRHAMDIWEYIAAHDNGVTTFHCELSADLVNDGDIEFLAGLRKGLLQFEIGVQTFNLKTLKAVNRHTDMEKLCNVVRKLKAAGNIHIHLDLIAGLPYEDIGSFAESFTGVYNLSPDELQLGFLKVLPGSGMAAMEEEYGIVRSDYAPYEVMSTKWMSYDDILLLKKIETVVGIYFNSRQFDSSVKYILEFFKTPFVMYRELGEYYEKGCDTGTSHSRVKRYELLYEFGREVVDDPDFLRELLVHDIYLRENCKTRPPYALPENDYTYNECRRMGVSRKLYHAERYEYDVNDFLVSGRKNKCEMIYIYDYSKRNPLTNNVQAVPAGNCTAL